MKSLKALPSLFSRLRSPRAQLDRETADDAAERAAGARELRNSEAQARRKNPLQLSWGGGELAPFPVSIVKPRVRADHWWQDGSE